jgi:hypothetical protein
VITPPSIERRRWYEQEGFVQIPAVSRDAEQALRRAMPLNGRYRVACATTAPTVQ